ncbi:MAG: T9SS type A sorting domain-containing protein [Ignavibacteriaceae bacterium]|nr:T9SS type A sorting domain-containing protein [Ignavibacteriaceae bacterium]
MYAYNDTLYVAGQFSQVGNFSGGSGIPANRIARWDGNNWSAIGQGLEGIPEDLIVRNNYIYVAGNLSGANPPFEVIYKYDGLNWNLLATANGSFTDISFFESENSFYIGGNFSSVSTLGTANNLVRFVDSSAIITSIKNTDEIIIPSEFVLSQNYPNPFNPSTKISWQSPVSGHQTLKVYDILGNEVATLVDEYREAGRYEIEFNAEVGSLQMASGVYYYQLRVGDTSTGSGQSFISTKKMIYLK